MSFKLCLLTSMNESQYHLIQANALLSDKNKAKLRAFSKMKNKTEKIRKQLLHQEMKAGRMNERDRQSPLNCNFMQKYFSC